MLHAFTGNKDTRARRQKACAPQACPPLRQVSERAQVRDVERSLRMASSGCQPPAPPSGWCGPTDLYARSYTLPPRWPFPAIHLVMEVEPGSCDLYHKPGTCCALIGPQM